MKIPDSVRIGGIDYDILFEPDVNNGRTVAYGQIDYENCNIKLSTSIKMNHQYLCIVLWHEMLHGIAEHANLEIADEENVVEILARGIYQVLQDNGRELFDIATQTSD